MTLIVKSENSMTKNEGIVNHYFVSFISYFML